MGKRLLGVFVLFIMVWLTLFFQSDSEPRLKRKPEDAEWEGDTPPVAPVHTTGEGLTVQSHSEVHCDSAASVSFGNPSKLLKLDL